MALILHKPERVPSAAAILLAVMLTLPTLAAPEGRVPRTFGTEGPTVIYVVIGDSTAAAVGATEEEGIAIATARALAETHRVVLTNLGVSGARARDVLEDQLRAAEALRPDVVLLTVGANDVTHLTPLCTIRKSIAEIVGRLKRANPDVDIVVTGSPDMGSPPRIPRLLRGIASWRTKQVNRVFDAEVKRSGVTLAPIAAETGPLFRRDHSLFAADQFHPNARGYAVWIPVLNRALAATR
jgi:lysophospholipase L1-like esterase